MGRVSDIFLKIGGFLAVGAKCMHFSRRLRARGAFSDIENPPLLVVCDLDRFEVHTNFTGTVKQVHEFDLAGLAEPAAARELDELRQRWLNPPEWTRTELLEFPGSADGPWKRYINPATIVPTRDTLARSASEGLDVQRETGPRSRVGLVSGVGTVRYPRIVAKDEECATQLKKRTLTNLYNERPTWLDLAHRKLDEAVFAAYGWNAGMGDEELLGRLLELNLERASHAH
jgi:hypothetical protein